MNRLIAAAGSLILGSSFLSTTAFAFSLNVLGRIGYQSDTAKKIAGETTDPEAATGLGLGVLAQYELMDFEAASIWAGAGLQYTSLSNETTVAPNVTAKNKQTGMTLPLELAVSFDAIPMATLQAGVGYDVGLSGKVDVDLPSGDKSYDIEKFGQTTFTGRALFTPFPTLRAGLEYQYHMGTIRVKTEAPKDRDFSGSLIGAVVGINL